MADVLDSHRSQSPLKRLTAPQYLLLLAVIVLHSEPVFDQSRDTPPGPAIIRARRIQDALRRPESDWTPDLSPSERILNEWGQTLDRRRAWDEPDRVTQGSLVPHLRHALNEVDRLTGSVEAILCPKAGAQKSPALDGLDTIWLICFSIGVFPAFGSTHAPDWSRYESDVAMSSLVTLLNTSPLFRMHPCTAEQIGVAIGAWAMLLEVEFRPAEAESSIAETESSTAGELIPASVKRLRSDTSCLGDGWPTVKKSRSFTILNGEGPSVELPIQSRDEPCGGAHELAEHAEDDDLATERKINAGVVRTETTDTVVGSLAEDARSSVRSSGPSE